MHTQKYNFYANQPVQNKDTVKFVQLSVQANLVTKKLGCKYNNVVKRKLFDYNITPKINTDVVIQNNSAVPGSLLGECNSPNNKESIEFSHLYEENNNCQEVIVSTASCVNYAKRLKQTHWYREQASSLDQELDDYMSTCTKKQTLDKELDEYMEEGRKAAEELVQVKQELEEN